MQALTLPITAAIAALGFLYQQWNRARLAQQLKNRKAAVERACSADKPMDEDQQEAACLAEELGRFETQLRNRAGWRA